MGRVAPTPRYKDSRCGLSRKSEWENCALAKDSMQEDCTASYQTGDRIVVRV